MPSMPQHIAEVIKTSQFDKPVLPQQPLPQQQPVEDPQPEQQSLVILQPDPLPVSVSSPSQDVAMVSPSSVESGESVLQESSQKKKKKRVRKHKAPSAEQQLATNVPEEVLEKLKSLVVDEYVFSNEAELVFRLNEIPFVQEYVGDGNN